ncbi:MULTISPECIES: protein-glutamate O-methyltransferase CheR [Cyanophyceae]|uniref:CheR family methyltransferase n=1 Tax=Cyanophyceae TaxID=3028117 RepID=UPI00168487BF|nr:MULTISPECIES: protein-glutamate O-methyltransferase CheR [Cyanophyceae]MBD1916166.1 tetratricopeptide repeat protein [Phormidium sp. FACHB-77]MBD2031565.1 tetratricopeptide repeat protein [Phormidium sp. FACHB-322]MBD2052808.1 tetratricopeptide repeat protein [Leptolyngbya sp. FACHB-60]
MDDLILKRISDLIADHSGLYVRPQDFQLLSDKVWLRAKALGLTTLADYHDYLKALDYSSRGLDSFKARPSLPQQQSEWQELYSILTINESYFFRDSNQLRLLSDRLLPEIMQRKQAAAPLGSKPSLRIWSAGCSTGEELYSIAIALDQLNFAWHQWDVQLIGTDISAAAVHSARQGLYSSWSFRQTPAALQQTYFQVDRQAYRICDRLQQHVVFEVGNLLKDPCPNFGQGPGGLDLILCRNVFIYLDRQAIGQIIRKFHGALIPQGYLLTGHTELYGQNTSPFEVTSFPETVVYQKPPQTVLPLPTASLPAAQWQSTASPQPLRLAPKAASPSVDASLDDSLTAALQAATTFLQQNDYTSAIRTAKQLYLTHPDCTAAHQIAARAYANTGCYSQAKQLCQRVIRDHPLSLDMHYLLAQIAEDENDLEIAKEHLRKIIYLDPDFVKAYLDLASIYARARQPEKAKTTREHALTLLAKLPPSTVLDDHSDATVAQWQAHLKQQIAGGDRQSPQE